MTAEAEVNGGQSDVLFGGEDRAELTRPCGTVWTEAEKLKTIEQTYFPGRLAVQKFWGKYLDYLKVVTAEDPKARRRVIVPYILARGSSEIQIEMLSELQSALTADGLAYDVHVGAGDSYQPLMRAANSDAFQIGLDLNTPGEAFFRPDIKKVQAAVLKPSSGAMLVPLPFQLCKELLAGAQSIYMICPNPISQEKHILEMLMVMNLNAVLYVYPDQRDPTVVEKMGYAFSQFGTLEKLTARDKTLKNRGIEADFFRGKRKITYYEIKRN